MELQLQLWEAHPKQVEILQHPARYKVVNCGRKLGKTTMAVNYLVEQALLNNNASYVYLAPWRNQAKEIAWDTFIVTINKLPKQIVKNKNETELSIEFFNNSKIRLAGADNIESQRGKEWNGIVVDEVASMRDWYNIWQEVIRPNLSPRKGWAMFISTPKGFNHFHELYQTEKEDKDYKSFHFTSYDNPYVDPEEIDKAKLELAEDAFAQEYLADFRKFTGLIYKDFSRDTHVIPQREIDNSWYLWRAVDFGDQNPTAWLWIISSPQDEWYVVDEIYVTETSIFDLSGIVKAKTDYWLSKGFNIAGTFGDPSGAAFMREYSQFGTFITPARKDVGETGVGWIVTGISRIEEKLKIQPDNRKPKLFIFNNCTNLINEFERYHWKETRSADVNAPQFPEKATDHALDALRYFAVSAFTPQKEKKREYKSANEFTGY